MKDFLIKLLGGYRAVIVVIDRRAGRTIIINEAVTFYPFCQRIFKTKSGIVSIDRNNRVTFKERII